ncbi:MAG: DUF805 domain-containing protein [Legionellales bacterium]|nr:DUF805 domain-containing protein [Legionellales bacterium]|tara:strand:+ start:711 stop:1085 length:375 start_codon:yes stop_codon:yes gene_type:complete
MEFNEAYKTCLLNKYAAFSGRASRSEYWYFFLFLVLLAIVTSIIDAAIFPGNELMPTYSIFSLLTIIPSISAAARRLHDVDRSGWWQLLYFTIIGSLLVLYWLIKKSDSGNNKHGTNPLQTLPE